MTKKEFISKYAKKAILFQSDSDVKKFAAAVELAEVYPNAKRAALNPPYFDTFSQYIVFNNELGVNGSIASITFNSERNLIPVTGIIVYSPTDIPEKEIVLVPQKTPEGFVSNIHVGQIIKPSCQKARVIEVFPDKSFRMMWLKYDGSDDRLSDLRWIEKSREQYTALPSMR